MKISRFSRYIASTIIALAFAALACNVSAAPQSSPKPVTVARILKGMSANIAGISSFEVPAHIVVHVKKGIFSIPFTMEGNRYFKAPDRNALKVVKGGNPELVKTLQSIYALLGAPATWEQTHNIWLQETSDVDGHHAYALLATPKRQSNVARVVLDVDTATFDPVRTRWSLRDGSTITMDMRQGVVDGKYRLALHDDIVFNLSSYHGTATVDYGTYAINVPVADSVFAP